MISFKVVAPLLKGEELGVCGDASSLGAWKPENAVRLYTTPTDYPLWYNNESVALQPNRSTAYRYCVLRGGRFHRWEKVGPSARILSPSTDAQAVHDTFDCMPPQERLRSEQEGGPKAQTDVRLQGKPPSPQVSSRVSGSGAQRVERGPERENRFRPKPFRPIQFGPYPSWQEEEKVERDSKSADEKATPCFSLLPKQGPSSATETETETETDTEVPSDEFSISPRGSVSSRTDASSGGRRTSLNATYMGAEYAGDVPDCLERGDSRGLSRIPGCPGSVPAPGAVEGTREGEGPSMSLKAATQAAERGAFYAGGTSRSATVQGGAWGQVVEDGNRLDKNSDFAVNGSWEVPQDSESKRREAVSAAVEMFAIDRFRLGRPPSLEGMEGEGGLGLGLRLGAETMSSPLSAADVPRKKAHLWSPKAGGVIVVSYYLPVTLKRVDNRDDTSGKEGAAKRSRWIASWDHEKLLSLQTALRVVRVGTIKYPGGIKESERADVTRALADLNCVPVFLTESLAHRCYYKYCKGVLWPVLHNIMEMYDSMPNSLWDYKAIMDGWSAFKDVNRAFRDKVVEAFHEGDLIWVNGFHLAILPAYIERAVKVARISLFLHTPFPPGEVFRALPQRDELLLGMLGADQVGFHRFVDSRHFLSSCRKLLGLQHVFSPETGMLHMVHGDKPVIISTVHAGVEPDIIRTARREREAEEEVSRLRALHKGRQVFAGIERVERLKGVWLKMLAFENMLATNPDLVGRVSLHEVGITNTERGSDYRACQQAMATLTDRINSRFGEGTVVYEEKHQGDITLAKRTALMSVASVFIKIPVHDGLSTAGMEYRIIQELELSKKNVTSPGVLILSESVSSVLALRGCLAVNPWKVDMVSAAMASAVTAGDAARKALHQEDIDWCESHTTTAWAEDVLGVLTTVPKESRARYATTGLGLTGRVVGTDPSFKRLATETARRAYSASTERVFFLDYGGTLVEDDAKRACASSSWATASGGEDNSTSSTPAASRWSFRGGRGQKTALRPSSAVLDALQELCRDARNIVFVVSGRGKNDLEEAFGCVQGLGLAAEHGSFFKWPNPLRRSSDGGARMPKGGCAEDWELLHPGLLDDGWKAVAHRFMRDFQVHTHGSYVEEKGSSILWHYEDADREVGVMQAKKLQDELEDVLCSDYDRSTVPKDRSKLARGRLSSEPRSTSSPAPPPSTSGSNLTLGPIAGAVAGVRDTSGGVEIVHEMGQGGRAGWVGGGGGYLEVRAKGCSKGQFVHAVFERLGWANQGMLVNSPASRFCLCIGDDVSDEDMFLAVKAYGLTPGAHGNGHQDVTGRAGGAESGRSTAASPGLQSTRVQQDDDPSSETRQMNPWLMTVTVESKPSEAQSWLPGVHGVISLLRSLPRPSRREALLTEVFPELFTAWTKGNANLSGAQGDLVTRSTSDTGWNGEAMMGDSRSVRASSTGNPDVGLPGCGMSESCGGTVGSAVPVVRRHSYSVRRKPMICLSLHEFLQEVAQPDPEPLMF